MRRSRKEIKRQRVLRLTPGEITIDATGKSLGRLASEVAILLQGKNVPQYRREHLVGPEKVKVVNLEKLNLPARKLKRVYYRHTGYPGGVKTETLEERWKKNPSRAFERTVAGMLPKNKLQREMLRRLIIIH